MTQGFELFAKIGGDASGLQRALGNAQRAVGGAGQSLQRLAAIGAKSLAAVGAAAAAATAALAAFTRSGMNAVDEQAKLARSLDASIDGLRGVQIAAADAGIESGALGTSLQMLNSRLAEAARGTGTAAQAMERLGLDAQALMGLDVDERMAVIADRMQELGFSAGQAQDELAQLGIRNRQLALLMTQGGDAIRNARQEVDDFGLSVSEVDASQVEIANDAFARVGRAIEGVRNTLAVEFAPALHLVSELFNDAVREAGGFTQFVQPAVERVTRAVGALVDAVTIKVRVFRAAQEVMVSVARTVGDAFSQVLGVVRESLNFLIRQVNRLADIIPGINAQLSEIGEGAAMRGLEAFFDRGREAVTGFIDNFMDEFGRDLPSSKINQRLDETRERLQLMAEEAVASRQRVAEVFDEPLITEQSTDKSKGELSELEQFGIQAARNIQTSFADFLFNPFQEGLKGMLRGFVDLLRRMVAELAARAAMMAFLNFLAGGSGTAATLAAKMIAGSRERGGPVMSQQPYMVGERGPEMFVPHGAGRIVPNNQLQGGGGTMVTVNINAEDPGAEGRIRTMVERELAPQIVQAAVGQTFGRLQRPRFA